MRANAVAAASTGSADAAARSQAARGPASAGERVVIQAAVFARASEAVAN